MLIFRGLPGAADPYVKITDFNFRSSMVLEIANEWSKIAKLAVFINAIDNGIHGPKTLHGKSLAWDLGVEGHQAMDFDLLGDYLKMRLPPPYEVIVEVDHIHIEWDTKLGR